MSFVDEVVDGEELDGGDAEFLEVVDGGRVCQAGVGAAEGLGDGGVAVAEAFDVDLVDDGVGEGDRGAAVVVPVEVGVDDDGFGDTGGGVLGVDLGVVAGDEVVGEDGGLPVDVAGEGLGVGVDEELGGVESLAVFGVPGAVDAVTVELSGFDVADEAVPDEGGVFAEGDALGLVAGAVEEAEVDAGGVFREEGEVGSLGGGGGAEGVGATGEQGAVHARLDACWGEALCVGRG